MKVRPFLITSRYAYRPDLIPETGSPLYDKKHERCIAPTSTVRVKTQILTPKQIVYILHHPNAYGTPEEANPLIALPMYLLHKDGNVNNIAIENLKPSSVSGRWNNNNRNPMNSNEYIEAPDGTLVPKHLIAIMTPEQLEQYGLTADDIYKEAAPHKVRRSRKKDAPPDPFEGYDPFEGMYI